MGTNQNLKFCQDLGFTLSKISEYSKIVLNRNFGKLCLINGTVIWVQQKFSFKLENP